MQQSQLLSNSFRTLTTGKSLPRVRRTWTLGKLSRSRANFGRSSAQNTVNEAEIKAPDHVLAIDYGTWWTGLALSNKGICRELEVIRNDPHKRADFAKEVISIAEQHTASTIVIGIPLDPFDPESTLTNPDTDSYHARRCRWFAHAVALAAFPRGLTVLLYDESTTSSDARRILGVSKDLKKKGANNAHEIMRKKLDSLSAFLLLRSYLEAPGRALKIVVKGGRKK